MKQNKKGNKRLWKLLCMVVMVFLCVLGSVMWWTEGTEKHAHKMPVYPKENIEYILDKEVLETADYELLFQQTGMRAAGVDFLYEQNRQQELLELQQNFFADVDVECEENTIITREERIDELQFPRGMEDTLKGREKRDITRVSIPYVEPGDILITFNCHAFGWRNGHAAMVVDAEERKAIEARVLGTDSAIVSMNHWERYPSFAVLRLKGVTKEQREKIAAYAVENLTGIPYRLEAGIFTRAQLLFPKAVEEEKEDMLPGTHCAHLIWHAYKQYGYDLDSDGGVIVTPKDIFESPMLEVVQVYGMSF